MSISRKINLVGSASLKAINYYSDFDLNELFNETDKKTIQKYFTFVSTKI